METLVIAATGAVFVAVLSTSALAWSLRRTRSLTTALTEAREEARALRERFTAILDIEQAAAAARQTADAAQAELTRAISALRAESDDLRNRYAVGMKRAADLSATIASLEENLENVELGLYRPHFSYADTESYKRAIEEVRQKLKTMRKSGTATSCETTWTVGGNKKEGERMVRQTEKLLLRAFNAESESAVANVSWNNLKVMKERMNKAFEMLNKHGTVIQVAITEGYRSARLEELQLVFEAAEKKHREREDERRQRAEQREEERVQKELQCEQEVAAKDEIKYSRALQKAQEELAEARDEEREAMLARINSLEKDLAAAHERKERAVAQAQLTKAGHVYVISNMGAFGEEVVKIGMTRRLKPEERIRELGDASVPFPFDLHALIYSENAPELETKLHNHFWERRLNWANDRKEFFRVGFAEIQAALKEIGLNAELAMVPEAREYRETVASLVASKTESSGVLAAKRTNNLPEDPFETS